MVELGVMGSKLYPINWVYGKNEIVGTGQKLNNQSWGMKSKIILDYRSMVFSINPDWIGV